MGAKTSSILSIKAGRKKGVIKKRGMEQVEIRAQAVCCFDRRHYLYEASTYETNEGKQLRTPRSNVKAGT
jgi:hypothetical protein